MKREKKEKGCEVEINIDFLGYCFTPSKTLLRKRLKRSFARKIKKIKNPKRRQEILAAYWGWCKWGNCKHLWNKITNNDMSFSKRGIKNPTRTKDGKRFFDYPSKKMFEILNEKITIIDFETGIKTKNGEDRYAILFLMKDDKGEEVTYKVITNSFTLKGILDEARIYDKKLLDLQKRIESLRNIHGDKLKINENFNKEECEMLETNEYIFPQETIVRKRDLGGGKYDYYFE